MKYAAAPRREIGIRTIFNLLGPLTNPAGADRQLLGIFDRTKTETIAKVLHELKLKRGLVVASYDGLDEISIHIWITEGKKRDKRCSLFLLKLGKHFINAIHAVHPPSMT